MLHLILVNMQGSQFCKVIECYDKICNKMKGTILKATATVRQK